MDQHTRHIAPTRRRERKTVFADSRWKTSFILPYYADSRQDDIKQKQEENNYDAVRNG